MSSIFIKKVEHFSVALTTFFHRVIYGKNFHLCQFYLIHYLDGPKEPNVLCVHFLTKGKGEEIGNLKSEVLMGVPGADPGN